MAKWALIGASYRMQLETAEVSMDVDQAGVKQGMCEASFWKARAHKKLEGEEQVTPKFVKPAESPMC